jgi:YHS domain-containing protein
MIRGLIYLLYVVIVLLIIRMVGRSLVRLFGAGSDVRRSSARTGAPSRKAEDLVRDPVCNTYVPRSRALTAVVEGHEEHFCSEACRDRARAGAARAS